MLQSRLTVGGTAGDGDPAPETRFHARLLGTFRLTFPDGRDALPPGRKPRALLAYLLATAGGEAVPRPRLATLLWSERSDEQARASLRQALHEIRHLTGGSHPMVVVDRSHARIARGLVGIDVDAFHSGGSPGGVAALLGPPGSRWPELLADLGGIDPAYDEWLTGERQRSGDALRSSVLAAAARSLDDGDSVGAQRLAGRLLAADPLDETAGRLAMQAAHHLGDKDGVRLVHLRLAEALRAELGVETSDDTRDLHRQLMAMPSPVTAGRPPSPAVTTVDSMPSGSDAPDIDRAGDGSIRPAASTPFLGLALRRLRRDRRTAAVALAAAFTVAACVLGVVGLRVADAPVQRTLVVDALRIADGDAPARTLDRGLPTDLSRLIVGHDRVLSIVDGGGASRRRPPADFVLTGDAQSQGAVLRVDLQLLSGNDPHGAILWSHAYSRPAVDIDALREQIAVSVADVAVCALGGHTLSVDDLDPDTMRLLLAACEKTRVDAPEAARFLQQVVARRPRFAHGWAMLATATALSSGDRPDQADALLQQADGEARRALALDPHDGEAYLARTLALSGPGQWAPRVAMLQAGLSVDPGNAWLHDVLAEEYGCVGRLREAIATSQRGWALDSFNPDQATVLARLLGYSGDVDDANAMLRIARTRFPGDPDVARTVFWLAAFVGDIHEAVDLLANPQRGFEMLPDRVERWRTVLAARLDPSAADKVDAAVKSVLAPSGTHGRIGTHVLADLVRLGRLDTALAQLSRMNHDAVGDDMAVLFSQPMAALRADPRFMEFAARTGLVGIWLQTDRWPDFCHDQALPYDCRVEARRLVPGTTHPGA